MEKERKNLLSSAAKGLKRLHWTMGLALLGIVAVTSFVHFTFAALVVNMSDTIANPAASASSLHTIIFNLSAANTFINGEQIAIDFPEISAFTSGGAWAASDFTFADGVARVINSVASGPGVSSVVCANGANNVGVAVDTTALIFRVIPCGALFAPRAAGALVTFTINGAFPGGALTNPAAPGAYTINVINGAGDCTAGSETCAMSTVVANGTSVVVTATAPSQCGNGILNVGEQCDDGNLVNGDGCSMFCVTEGGGGSPPPSPPPPPTITNISATNITETTATVHWDTDQSANSRVNFGTTPTYTMQANNAAYVTSHATGLSALTLGTLYHFQVCSTNSSSSQTCSSDQTFSTADQTPPVIANRSVTKISCSGATITWDTNENASQFVDYGTSPGPSYTKNVGAGTPLQKNHSIVLTDLEINTVYHYRTRSSDVAANESFSSDDIFSTSAVCEGDTKPPTVTNVQTVDVKSTTATITWDTDENADSLVDFGTSVMYGGKASANTLVKMHTVALTGLTPSTAYHYRITSKDAAKNQTITSDFSFSTAIAEPCKVDCKDVAFIPYIINSDGSERKFGSSFVLFDHPTADTDRYRFEDNGVEMDFNDEVVTVDHAECGVATFALKNNTATRHHVVRAEIFYKGFLRKDVLLSPDSQAAENNTVIVHYTDDQKICAATPLSLTSVQATNITKSSARILWTTDKVTDSMVNYGPTSSYGFSLFETPATTNHLIVISGLAPGTIYHYRVRSTDGQGGVILSNDKTFTTLPNNIAPANVTDFVVTAEGGHMVLAWKNPIDSDFAGVKIVKKTTGFPSSPSDGEVVYDGADVSVVDMKVTNGVTYYYSAFSYDAFKNYASGAIASETPNGALDKNPPGSVIQFSATPGNNRILLQWTNPTDLDFQGVRIMRKTTGFPTQPTDGDLAYLGPDTSVLDSNLQNDVTYYYSAFSYDVANNFADGIPATATPSALAAGGNFSLGPVTNFVGVAGDTEVQLTWNNPSDANVSNLFTNSTLAGTRIVRNEKKLPSGPTDGTILFEGLADNFIDTGLTNGTLYHYGAFIYDAAQHFSPGVFTAVMPYKGAPAFINLACTDTDGAKNYGVKGSVTAKGTVYADLCEDTTTLDENYCQAGVRYFETHVCVAGEKCVAGACVPKNFVLSSEKCGNAICAENENSVTCPADCIVGTKVPPLPTLVTDVKSEEKLGVDDVRFFATLQNIPLRLSGKELQVYAGMAFRVFLPEGAAKKPIKEAYVNLGNSAYAMKKIRGEEAIVVAPAAIGTHQLTVRIEYVDGSKDFVGVSVVSMEAGSVYEATDVTKNVVDARVTLLVDTGNGNYGVWDGTKSGQANPQVTDTKGHFSFIVPEGTYKLIAEKEGYRTKETLQFPVSNQNIITNLLQLIALPPILDLTNPTSVLENAVFGAKVAGDAAIEVIQNPFVEKGTKVVAVPTAVAVAVVNVGAAGAATATTVPYLFYVYSFLAHPALLVARRRRKKWGIVYNSLTKLPVDLVIVRLLDAKTGKILRSAVTDKDGRYFFIIKPGEYKITAVKVGHTFPSVFLRGQKEDALFVDLYHGESITVTEETTITANIPLDPTTVTKTPRRIYFEGIGRRVQKSAGVLSIIGLIISSVIVPSVLTFSLLGGNILMFLVFRRLAVPRKPKNWGIVYDEVTKKPVKNVMARIFEAKYNKLLETQVTDNQGRYAFLIGNNVYYVTFERTGYYKEQKGPVDLIPFDKKKKEGAQVVAVDIPLKPATNGSKDIARSVPVQQPPSISPPVAPTASIEPTMPAIGAVTPKATPSTTYAEQMLARLKSVDTTVPPAVPVVPPEPITPQPPTLPSEPPI